MGYEVKLFYYEKVNDEYDKENVKELSKKLGTSMDDISLEKLSAFIMMQLARRDVFVFDLEVFEYKKSKINFKEAKGGILLKNKKFLFDGTEASVAVEELMQSVSEPEQQPKQLQPQQPTISVNSTSLQAPKNDLAIGDRHPVDWVMFSPEVPDLVEIKRKNIRLTEDKKYPVYEKRPSVLGDIYLMIDDLGREQLISDKYFVPARVTLFADELGFSQSVSKPGGDLYWGSEVEQDMFDIRKNN